MRAHASWHEAQLYARVRTNRPLNTFILFDLIFDVLFWSLRSDVDFHIAPEGLGEGKRFAIGRFLFDLFVSLGVGPEGLGQDKLSSWLSLYNGLSLCSGGALRRWTGRPTGAEPPLALA